MQVADPKSRLWTQDELHQMAELGFFEDSGPNSLKAKSWY